MNDKFELRKLVELTLAGMIDFIFSFFFTVWNLLINPHKIPKVSKKTNILLMNPLSFLLVASFILATGMSSGYGGMEEILRTQQKYFNENFSLTTVLIASLPLFLGTAICAKLTSKIIGENEVYNFILFYSALFFVLTEMVILGVSKLESKALQNSMLILPLVWFGIAVTLNIRHSELLKSLILKKMLLFVFMLCVPFIAIVMNLFVLSVGESNKWHIKTFQSESFIKRNSNYELKFLFKNQFNDIEVLSSHITLTLYHVPENYKLENNINSQIDKLDKIELLPLKVYFDKKEEKSYVLEGGKYVAIHLVGSALGWDKYFRENEISDIKGHIYYEVKFREMNDGNTRIYSGSTIDIY